MTLCINQAYSYINVVYNIFFNYYSVILFLNMFEHHTTIQMQNVTFELRGITLTMMKVSVNIDSFLCTHWMYVDMNPILNFSTRLISRQPNIFFLPEQFGERKEVVEVL